MTQYQIACNNPTVLSTTIVVDLACNVYLLKSDNGRCAFRVLLLQMCNVRIPKQRSCTND